MFIRYTQIDRKIRCETMGVRLGGKWFMGSKRILAFCLGLVLAASVLSACGGETVLPEGSIPDAVGTEDFQTEDALLPTQGPSTPTALPDAALSGYFREDARACIFYNQADGVSVESKTIMEFRYTANAR